MAVSEKPQLRLAAPEARPLPQPAHLRVDKATITDPEDDEVAGRQIQKQKTDTGGIEAVRPASTAASTASNSSRLSSVLQSLKSVFHWTTHSISGGMKNSESFILDNGTCPFSMCLGIRLGLGFYSDVSNKRTAYAY